MLVTSNFFAQNFEAAKGIDAMEPRFKEGDLAWLNFSLQAQEAIAKAEATFLYKRAKKRTEVKILEAVVDNGKFTVHYVVSLDLSPAYKISRVSEADLSPR